MAQLTIHGVPGTFHVDVSPDDENFDTVATELQKRAQSGEFDDAFVKAGVMAPPTKFAPTPQVEDALASKPDEPPVPGAYEGFPAPPEPVLQVPVPLGQQVGSPFPGHAPPPVGATLAGPGGIAEKRAESLRATPIMPSVGAPAAAVGTALGNIPSGMAEGLASGAADYASKIWDASNNVVPTAMHAIGVQPGVPSP